MIMGHEFSGRDPKGRAVAVNPIISCGKCDLCVSGRNEVCRYRSVVGIHRPGAFAERVAVPESQLYELPASVDIETGALVEPLANGLHAWRLAAAEPGARVGVLGAGTIGLAALLVAKHFGAQVGITDLSTDRLAFAERLGADVAGPALAGEFDVVIDAVGARATRRASLEHLRQAGTAVWIGLNEPEAEFDALDIIRMEKRIVGSFAYSNQDFGDAVFLAAEVDLHWVARFDLAEGIQIFSELMEGRTDIVKALLRPAPVRA